MVFPNDVTMSTTVLVFAFSFACALVLVWLCAEPLAVAVLLFDPVLEVLPDPLFADPDAVAPAFAFMLALWLMLALPLLLDADVCEPSDPPIFMFPFAPMLNVEVANATAENSAIISPNAVVPIILPLIFSPNL